MIGEIISGGLKLLGGFLDRNAANEAAEKKTAADYAMAKEFAQSGIQWRADDARKAGIHPLYAMGAPTFSAPTATVGDRGIGGALADMGQDVSRAINSTRTADQRETAFQDTLRGLTLRKAGLENDLLAAQIAKLRSAINPPMPGGKALIPGQGQAIVPEADKFEDRPRLAVGGSHVETSPKWSNAEDFEKRYGEISDWTAGPAILWSDLMHHLRRRGYNQKWGRSGGPGSFIGAP